MSHGAPGSTGIGVAATLAADIIADLAAAAWEHGYDTFWVNDLPNASGLEKLAVVRQVAPGIRLGVGVMAVDRWSPKQVVKEIARLGLPEDRLTLGIGAGELRHGSLAAVHSFGQELKRLTNSPVVVGALGPKMCTLGGEALDGALLNWATPEIVESLGETTRNASEGKASPWVGIYVRVAAEASAEERLTAESERYESFPSYGRHFQRWGVRARDTAVLGERSAVRTFLERFTPGADHVVVRAVAAEESLDANLRVLRAGAPRPAD